MEKKQKPGNLFIIAVEGPDGYGKTTLAKELFRILSSITYEEDAPNICYEHFPVDYLPSCKAIRQFLKNPDIIKDVSGIQALSNLFIKNRMEWCALADIDWRLHGSNPRIIVADRYYLGNVYQTEYRAHKEELYPDPETKKVDLSALERLMVNCASLEETNGIWLPDYTIFTDISKEEQMSRLNARSESKDVYEKDEATVQEIREMYEAVMQLEVEEYLDKATVFPTSNYSEGGLYALLYQILRRLGFYPKKL